MATAKDDFQEVATDAVLSRNDGYSFVSSLGALIHTGPTRPNVNDFRAIFLPAT